MKTYLKIILPIAAAAILAYAALHFAGTAILPALVGSAPAQTDVVDPLDSSLIGKRAPSFDLPQVGGGRMRLADILGSPAVIVFWATWNKESEDQLKILDDYMANEKGQATLVRVVAIDSQEDPSIVSSFMRRGGYSVPTLEDSFGDTSTAYGVKGLPKAYFIAKDGTISSIHGGILSEQDLVQKVEDLIGQGGI
jgi:peroxiredoxin